MRDASNMRAAVAALLGLSCSGPPSGSCHDSVLVPGDYAVEFIGPSPVQRRAAAAELELHCTASEDRSPRTGEGPAADESLRQAPVWGALHGDLSALGVPPGADRGGAPPPASADPVYPGVLARIWHESRFPRDPLGSTTALIIGSHTNVRTLRRTGGPRRTGLVLFVEVASERGFAGVWGREGRFRARRLERRRRIRGSPGLRWKPTEGESGIMRSPIRPIRWRAHTLLAFIPMLFAACAREPTQLYAGPPRARDAYAVLESERPSEVDVHSIDGARVYGSAWHIEPRAHEVWTKVVFRASAGVANQTVRTFCVFNFAAEAGGLYRFRSTAQITKSSAAGKHGEIGAVLVNAETGDAREPAFCTDQRPRL